MFDTLKTMKTKLSDAFVGLEAAHCDTLATFAAAEERFRKAEAKRAEYMVITPTDVQLGLVLAQIARIEAEDEVKRVASKLSTAHSKRGVLAKDPKVLARDPETLLADLSKISDLIATHESALLAARQAFGDRLDAARREHADAENAARSGAPAPLPLPRMTNEIVCRSRLIRSSTN